MASTLGMAMGPWAGGTNAGAFQSDYPEYARRVPRYVPNPFKARG